MQIHRYSGRPVPYELTFEYDRETLFYEQVVAKNALMLSRFDMDRIGMDSQEATIWAERGFALTARNNGDFITNQAHFDKDSLRRFGGLLAYFADTTDEELARISNNNPMTKEVFASRLYEGKIASSMNSTINERLKVPKLWKPTVRKHFGFSK